MMFSLNHLERQWASRAHRYRSLDIRSSVLGVDFEHALSTTSHFSKLRRFNSSVPFDSPVSKDVKSKASERVDWRPMTMFERIRQFPTGVFKLMKDYQLYQLIHDASRAPLNAWTIDRPSYRKNVYQESFYSYDDKIRPGRIPRRQYEQQRRAAVEIGALAPIILLWIPPIIGFLPTILGATAPRQILSRQFHNEYEIYNYAELEYQQRKNEFPVVAEMFWNTTILGQRASEVNVPCDKEDAAGPIIDVLPFYSIFAHDIGTSSNQQLLHGVLHSVDSIPRKYLIKLALAIGVNQNLPGWLSPVVTEWSPKRWLQYRVRQTTQVVSEDDRLLLLERHDEDGCSSLTDIEVMDAWYVMIRCFHFSFGSRRRHSRNDKRLTPSSHAVDFLLCLPFTVYCVVCLSMSPMKPCVSV
jgi:hypothetical protein